MRVLNIEAKSGYVVSFTYTYIVRNDDDGILSVAISQL